MTKVLQVWNFEPCPVRSASEPLDSSISPWTQVVSHAKPLQHMPQAPSKASHRADRFRFFSQFRRRIWWPSVSVSQFLAAATNPQPPATSQPENPALLRNMQASITVSHGRTLTRTGTGWKSGTGHMAGTARGLCGLFPCLNKIICYRTFTLSAKDFFRSPRAANSSTPYSHLAVCTEARTDSLLVFFKAIKSPIVLVKCTAWRLADSPGSAWKSQSSKIAYIHIYIYVRIHIYICILTSFPIPKDVINAFFIVSFNVASLPRTVLREEGQLLVLILLFHHCQFEEPWNDGMARLSCLEIPLKIHYDQGEAKLAMQEVSSNRVCFADSIG